MITRNRLAAHKAIGGWALPPPIQSENSCKSCMALPTCALAHAALENGTGETFGLPDHFAALTSHITPSVAAFLRHWLGLLELESAAGATPQEHIWALPPPLPPAAPDGDAALQRGGVPWHSKLSAFGIGERHTDAAASAQCPAGCFARPMTPSAPELPLVQSHAPTEAGQAGGERSAAPASKRHPLAGRCVGYLVMIDSRRGCDAYPLYPHTHVFRQQAPAELLRGGSRI